MKTLFTGFLLAISVAVTSAQSTAALPRSEFLIDLSESSLSLKPGETKTVSVSILRSKSFSSRKVVLSTSNSLPKGIVISFEPTEGDFENSVATIAVASDAATGTYQLVLSGTISGKKKGSILKLIVSEGEVAKK